MILFGYDSLKKEFIRSFRSGKNHHAWIISGERGIGKGTFARLISRSVLANKYYQAFSFDDGEDIQEKVYNESHPDFYVLTPDEKGVIGVESVRNMIKFMQLTPVEGTNKVAVIDHCDGMTISAANSLLKILEEPPAGSLILLVSNAIGKLLPTIRSRCRTINVDPPTTQIFSDVINHLGYTNIDMKEMLELYNFTNGSIGLAVKVIENECMDLIASIKRQLYKSGDLGEVMDIASQVSKSQDLWEISSYAIITSLQDLIRNLDKYSKECEKALDALQKSAKIISDCDRLYLDKSSAIIAILG